MTTPTLPRNDRAEGVTKDGSAKPTAKKGRAGAERFRKKKLVIVGALLVVAVTAYSFLLKPKPTPSGEPEPGLIVKLDPLTLNLADGRYLKLAMALQFTAAASSEGHGEGGEPDGSKALDLAIAQLSNRKIAELNTAQARDAVKKTLLDAVTKAYHDEVMDIYFTEFVMQ